MDPEQPSAFWDKLSERLRQIARLRGLSTADADDVVQEALRDAVEGMKRGKFKGTGTPKGWVYGIFSHKLADFQRNAGRSQQRLMPLEALTQASEQALATERSNPEDVVMVRDALMQLPSRERAALILNTLFGLAAREFAPLLGVPRRKASEILTRAKNHFAQAGAAAQKAAPLKRLKK